MLKMLIMAVLSAIILVSCTDDQTKVQYLTGQVAYVDNSIDIGDSGDSLIIRHNVIIDSAYGLISSDRVWGYHIGVVPEEERYDGKTRTSRTWYEITIKQ